MTAELFTGKPASRNIWRNGKDYGIKQGRELFKVPFECIVEGWNPRTIFEGISELAINIRDIGLQNPLQGDLVENEDGTVNFILIEGARRYRAIKYLRDHCDVVYELVEVVPLPAKMTAEDKIFSILSSGVHKSEYKPMEIANAIMKLKELGLTNAVIGERMGKSRQWVDNMIKLGKMPEEKKEAIVNGTLKPTNALRSSSIEERDDEILSTELPPFHTTTADDNPQEDFKELYKPDTIYVPERTDPESEMVGILPKQKGPFRDAQLDVKDLEKEMEKEETVKDIEIDQPLKNILKLCAKIEKLGKGLNEQGQTDLDSYLKWIRNDITTLREQFKNKLKR